jgi:hypothetical protein
LNIPSRLFVEITLQTATIFLFIASLACLVFGLALIFRLEMALRLSVNLNHWVSTRQALRPLEASRDIQRHLYRRHPWVGAFLVLGSCYVVYFLFFRYSAQPFEIVFRKTVPLRAIQWAMQSVWWIVLVTNIFAFFIGIIMFWRPSLLKGIEAWADKAYSSRESTKFWETMNLHPDRIVQNYPSFFGWLIIVGSIYAALSLGFVLLGWRWY